MSDADSTTRKAPSALSRHLIYALIAAAVIVPMLVKTPCNFRATPASRQMYEFIDQLEPGSHVLMSFDFSPDAKAELLPMAEALLRHCFEKDLIPIAMAFWPQGEGMAKQALETVAKEYDKSSGTDYVLLGFKPGYGNLLLNMGEDFKSAFPSDAYGEPTTTMEALASVKTLKDIDLAIDLAAGLTVEMWVIFGSDRYGFKLAAGTTAVAAPKYYPYLNSQQIVGLLGGLRAAADYEQLVGHPADASELMLPQTIAHLLLIVLLVGANARFIARRLKGKVDS